MALLNFIKFYFRSVLNVHKSIFLSVFQRILFHSGSDRACFLKNLEQKIAGRSVRFLFHPDIDLYSAVEGSQKHFFGEKLRGFSLYQNGLDNRGEKLAKSYMLDRIDFEEDDIIIDCGANYSDLLLYIGKHIKEENYHTFEPSPREFLCIQKNASLATNNEMGLNSVTGQSDFFVSSDGGDSSILEPSEGHSEKTKIDTITLDDYFRRKSLANIKLLKLEAEGLEPEILMGATASLKNIEYIAVDGGPERGINSEETLSAVSNFLLLEGFILVGIDIPTGWGRTLFRRVD